MDSVRFSAKARISDGFMKASKPGLLAGVRHHPIFRGWGETVSLLKNGLACTTPTPNGSASRVQVLTIVRRSASNDTRPPRKAQTKRLLNALQNIDRNGTDIPIGLPLIFGSLYQTGPFAQVVRATGMWSRGLGFDSL